MVEVVTFYTVFQYIILNVTADMVFLAIIVNILHFHVIQTLVNMMEYVQKQQLDSSVHAHKIIKDITVKFKVPAYKIHV